MPGRILLIALLFLGALLLAPPARADEPVVTVRGLGSWSDALAALRADTHAQGRTLHAGVRVAGKSVGCRSYHLELDAAALEAFHLGRCDPDTDETELVLTDRAALFDHQGHVPRPRVMAISTVVTFHGFAVAGGGPQGGSAVHCSWAVRPYLDDQEHGTHVMLTPEHYALQSGSAWVSATPDGSGWNLSTSEAATFHLEYEVVERATGQVVLRQTMNLACGPKPEPSARPTKDSATIGMGIAAGVLHTGLLAGQAAMIWKAVTSEDPNVHFAVGYGMIFVVPLAAATGAAMVLAAMPPAKQKPRRRAAVLPVVGPADRSRGALVGLSGTF